MKLFDRVKETTTSTGAGNITLAGAAPRYVTFASVFAVGDEQIPYVIEGQTGSEWEVGLGTYVSADTLRRDLVYASSNAGSLVNFSAGTKDVFLTGSARVLKSGGRQMANARGYYLP